MQGLVSRCVLKNELKQTFDLYCAYRSHDISANYLSYISTNPRNLEKKIMPYANEAVGKNNAASNNAIVYMLLSSSRKC